MPIDKTFENRFGEHELRSVRESVAMLVKTIPVDITLTTSGTAQDLINIEAGAAPAENLITNPSMETGAPPTGWTAVGSALAQVGSGIVAPRTGSFSLQVDTDGVAAGEGAFFNVVSLPPGWYTLSAYVRRAAGGTVRIRASSDAGVTFMDGPVVTMDDTWQRTSVKVRIMNAATSALRLYVMTDVLQNITFFVEDAQMEPAWEIVLGMASSKDDNPIQSSLTAFVDPASERYSRWLGTANASISVREPTIWEINEIHLEAVNANTYIDFDRAAQRTGGAIGILMRAGDTINGRKVIKNNISFINEVVGQLPRLRGWVLGQ